MYTKNPRTRVELGSGLDTDLNLSMPRGIEAGLCIQDLGYFKLRWLDT